MPLLDLAWIPDGWWRLVTGERTRGAYPERVDRQHFEACVFSQLLWDPKAGDLCIVDSGEFADYNRRLIAWNEYDRKVARLWPDTGAVGGRAGLRRPRPRLAGGPHPHTRIRRTRVCRDSPPRRINAPGPSGAFYIE